LVEHLEANGGIVYAMSNTPEFGAGANTFNEVFGATLNPWNTTRSAAGSSGGAAVALATGMAWVAHGSDMGGSLRNPASFCSVVGFRPSIGRVARTPTSKIDRTLSVQGPMARNVEDVALLLDAMAGEHAADPLSLPKPPRTFRDAMRSGWRPQRVAYSADLGITPVDPEVAEVTRAAVRRLEGAGAIVEEAHPDLSEAHDCFKVLRAFDFAVSKAVHLRNDHALLKPELAENIEKGTGAHHAGNRARRDAACRHDRAHARSLTPSLSVAARRSRCRVDLRARSCPSVSRSLRHRALKCACFRRRSSWRIFSAYAA